MKRAHRVAYNSHRFGEQRTVRDGAMLGARALHGIFGVADPANYLHHLYLKRALNSIPHISPRRILDAGSGRGDHSIWLARRFPEATVVALEIDAQRVAALRLAVSRLGITNLVVNHGDLRELKEVTAYDLVISIDVLEHIPEQGEVLRRLRRALMGGGQAYFHVPTSRPRPVPFHRFLADFLAWGDLEHTAEEVTSKRFLEIVENSGFEIASVWPTFGYWTGEMATSLFAIPYRNTPLNRLAQIALVPLCRMLAMADLLSLESTRFAVGTLVRAE